MRWKDGLGVDQCSRGLASCISSCWPNFLISSVRMCWTVLSTWVSSHPQVHHESLHFCLRSSSKAARIPSGPACRFSPHVQCSLHSSQPSTEGRPVVSAPARLLWGPSQMAFCVPQRTLGRLKPRCPSQRSQYCALSASPSLSPHPAPSSCFFWCR